MTGTHQAKLILGLRIFPRQRHEMHRPGDGGGQHEPAGLGQRRLQQGQVEDVMMQAPVLGVVPRAFLELRPASGIGVAAQVVQGQNLRKVGLIVLAGAISLVGAQMRQRRPRPAVVERVDGIGDEEE